MPIKDLELGEQMNLLIENMSDAKPVLFEAKGGFNLRFQFMEADRENLNKRMYPLKVLSQAIKEAQEKIDAGKSLYGSTDHKVEMGVDDVSHRLLSVEMKAKEAWCEAAVLPTKKGNNLQAIIRSGGSVGVSARGYGVVENVGGKQVVATGYQLQGVDCVLNPSFDVAISKANIFESQEFNPSGDPESLSRRWEQAVKAGYRGSKVEYTQAINKNVDSKELDQLFQQALLSGFAGSYQDYCDKIYLRRK